VHQRFNSPSRREREKNSPQHGQRKRPAHVISTMQATNAAMPTCVARIQPTAEPAAPASKYTANEMNMARRRRRRSAHAAKYGSDSSGTL
jgi:hypothetical protein